MFEADPYSLYRLYMMGGGNVGFKIPEYQRQYDWDRENIFRLVEDVLNGLNWRIKDEESLTFLGSIIIVKEEQVERSFDSISYSIVDGQQRLTTISLLALYIYDLFSNIDVYKYKVNPNTKDWLFDEVNAARNRLLELIRGQLPVNGNNYPFPRIVREENKDHRGSDSKYSEYRSPIAKDLFAYAANVHGINKQNLNHINIDGEIPRGDYDNNKEYIKYIVNDVLFNYDINSDLSSSLLNHNNYKKRGFDSIFKKTPSDTKDSERIFSECRDHGYNFKGILNLLSFSLYLMDHVIVTVAKATKERYAFDIFDALNTTGEPLTAIQTFKPQIIKFENSTDLKYDNSYSKEYIDNIESYINSFKGNDSRQKASRELVTPFALYLTGEKITERLDFQRNYFRLNFNNNTTNIEDKRLFIKKLYDISDFKERFWTYDNIDKQLANHKEKEKVLLCLRLLLDLNKKLTVPILARYHRVLKDNDNEDVFNNSVKALTAFVVLRRSATGGTKNIDRDFRKLMSDGIKGKPLKIGLKGINEPLSIHDLKEYFIIKLREIGITDRDTWKQKASKTDLGYSPKLITRFLLLAASHNSQVQNKNSYKLERTLENLEKQYLNYTNWKKDQFQTIEHIAPISRRGEQEWNSTIYSPDKPYLIHSIGNLTLLPKEENSAIANQSWYKKKFLYKAFAAPSLKEKKSIINNAKELGIRFSEKNNKVLFNTNQQLPLLQSISNSEVWNESVIEERTENILDLSWELISPWLFDNESSESNKSS